MSCPARIVPPGAAYERLCTGRDSPRGCRGWPKRRSPRIRYHRRLTVVLPAPCPPVHVGHTSSSRNHCRYRALAAADCLRCSREPASPSTSTAECLRAPALSVGLWEVKVDGPCDARIARPRQPSRPKPRQPPDDGCAPRDPKEPTLLEPVAKAEDALNDEGLVLRWIKTLQGVLLRGRTEA